ncbi:response regulator [Thalassoroseus pseudoceratinae]|uniref:response regulator n=1 Tax=Thalassoroseus pseudoceratinae TaxID=2713176 RepID=UPI00141E7828|nr:response regulator [Thalassoroseus pseudoceratinae]
MSELQVLVAEDDRVTADILGFNLRRRGLTFEVCSDGQLAWERLQEVRPKVLMTDHQMPRINGLDLIQRIRESESTQEPLPIFLCSAKGMEIDRQYIEETLKVSRVIFKPFSPRQVLRWIDEVLYAGTDAVAAKPTR